MSLAPEQDVPLEHGPAEPAGDVVPALQQPDPPAAYAAAWGGQQRPKRRLARVVAVVARTECLQIEHMFA